MSQYDVLRKMAKLSDNQISVVEDRELKRVAQGVNSGPTVTRSEVDVAIGEAERELKRTGVTIYGTDGPIKLTPMEHKFVLGYVKTGSVKEAIRFTGYEGKNASSMGYQLLNKPEVAKAISVMEKQHILASGLSELEIVAGIRNVTQLATEKGNHAAALKGFYMLGEYMDMWGSGSKKADKSNGTTINNLTINTESFVTSGDKKDIVNDIRKFANIMNIPMNDFGRADRPEVIKDITGTSILSDDSDR